MTKEEFEQGYCERSGISLEEYHKHFVTLPCNCDHSECKGWASLTNNKLVIKNHKRLYM